MPSNKKHHYVPRFYLKRFSQNGKSIGIFNLPRKLKILNGNLKNQCYENYFYGKDPLIEHCLGDVEGAVARILKEIARSQDLPKHFSHDYVVLLIFILIQFGRTKHSADVLDEMTDKFLKYLAEPKAKSEGIDLKLR